MTDERALAVQQPQTPMSMPAGMAAVAALDDEAFERNLSMLQKAQDRTRRIQQTLMTEGRDYGTVPGTKKPTLFKPGAEVLTLSYGFVARITAEFIEGDGVTGPAIRYDAQCVIHVGSWDGPIVAIGHGSCNSWEVKYRYRTVYGGLICPNCDKPGVIKTKARGNRPEQFWHPPDARPEGGCNMNFPIDHPDLQQRQPGEKVENPDPYDVMNTILKIAEKRAHVDAILRATGTSGLFTVEEEETTAKETPEVRSRREFNDWVAETGLDPVAVMDLGKTLYPDRDLRKLAVWERTAWRAIAERDLLYGTPERAAQPAQAPPPAEQAPAKEQAPPQQAAPAPAQQAAQPSATRPRNVTPEAAPATNVEARERLRAAARNGQTAEQAAERERELAAAGGARQWSIEELAEIGG